MNNEEGKIWYGLGIDNRGLEADARKSTAIFRGIGSDAVSEFAKADKSVNSLAVSMQRGIATALSGVAIAAFSKQIINVRGEMQLLEQSFEVLTGSAEKSKTMLSDIIGLATDSPLEMQPVAKAAQTLMGFGVETENVMGILRQLSDVSMGNQQRFESLALVYAQTQSAGKLMGQDLLQYINAGFNPLAIIAEQTGKSMAVLKEEMSDGAISAKMVADAFTSATSEGGKFYDMTKKQADTIVGVRATFEDSITQMFNNIGKDSEEFIKGGYEMATSLIQNYETIGRALASLIATYGTYKAAVLVATTVEKLRYQATLAQMAGMTKMQAIMDVLRAKTAALNKTMLANPYVLLATAVVAVGAALWMLSDNTDKVAEKMEEFNEKQDKIRSDTEGLVGIIQSETTTMYQKIKAYDELIAKSDALAKAYTLEKLMSGEVTQSEIGVILNKQREADEYKELIKIRNEAQKIYTELSSSPEGGFNVYGITEAKRDLDGANKAIDEYNSRVAKAQQIAKNGIRLEGIEENITLLTKETSTIDERTTAYEKLKELSPELASMYDQEAISLMSLAQAQEAASRAEQIATLRKEKMTNEGVISNMEGNALSGSYMGNPLQGVIDDIKLKNSSIDQQIADLLNKPLPTTTTGGGDGSPLAGTIKAYEEDNKRLKKLQEETAKNSEQFATYQRQIDANNLKISQINGALRQEMADATLKVEEEAHEAEMALKRSQTTDKIALIKLETAEQLEAIEEQKQAFAEKYKGQEDTQEYKSGMAAFGSLSSTITAQGKDQEAQINNEVAQEEQRQYEQRLKNFQTFAERYQALKNQHEENLEFIKQKGGSTADVDAEDQSYEDSLQSLNDEVLATIGEFESLGIEATDKVIDQMIAKLQTAKSKLVEDDADPTKIAAVNAEIERCIKLKEQNNGTSQSRSLKEWQDMEKQLNDCTDSFEQMGEAIGGVAGEVISTAGGIVSSTVSMVSSIAQLVDISINGTKAAAEGASTAIRAVESASVILAVISAVIQVATKIANLFSANKQAEEDHQKALLEITERNIDAQTQYNALLREEAILLAELNTIFGDDPYSAAIAGTERYSEAIQELRSAIKGSISDDELRSAKFIDLLTGGRANATQNLLKSYQSGTKGLSDIKIVTGSYTEKTGFLNLGKKQVDDYSSITSVYSDLVDQYGNLNTERAQTIVDTQKMSDEDKERLESMIALQEEADEAIQSINDYYSDIFGDMGSSLKDSLVDAFRNGTDAGEAFCKNMVSMLEQLGEDFAYSMSIGQVMADQQAKVDAINRDSTLTDQERAEKMMALAIETGEKAAAQQDDFNAYLEAFQQGAAKEGYNLWEADEERQASSKGIATASQESVDENNGRLTVIQGHTYGILESVKVIADSMTDGSASLKSGGGDSVSLLYGTTQNILDCLYDIKDNTEYCRRLDGMDTDLSSIKKGIDSLNKGITLKRR